MQFLTQSSTYFTTLPVIVDHKRKFEADENLTEGPEIKKICLSDQTNIEPGDDSNDEFREIVEQTHWITLEKFDELLMSQIVQTKKFGDRIKLVKNFFSRKGEQFELWIEVDAEKGQIVKLIFSETKFKSTALHRKKFLESKLNPDQKHFYMEVYEATETVALKPILEVYASKLGNYGELTSIKKGTRFTGSEVYSIYQRIETIFNTKRTFLYDDALLGIESPKLKVEVGSYPLRMFDALASLDDEGKSWYERKGFLPIACRNFPMLDEKPWNGGTITQKNAKAYRLAISTVRKTKLKDLLRLLEEFPESVESVKHLMAKYQKDGESTIHQLAWSIGEDCRIPDQAYRCMRDFELFHAMAIHNFEPPEGELSKADKSFFNALTILNEYCLFQKKAS
jgi:hypothetical protein